MTKTNTAETTEFFDAVAGGQIQTVETLVRANPQLLDAHDYNCFGATPITRVCFNDDRPMIAALIELGADVNRRSDWSMGPWSPLHSAIINRNSDLAHFLLDHGAILDVHGAAGLGRIDELKQMLDEDPERVTESGGDGCHPLHFADTPEVAQLLLNRGADIEARCVDHYSTPVQYLGNKRPDVARYLFSKGATPDIFSATMADDVAVVERLITENPDVLNARINQEFFPSGPEHNVDNIMTFTIGEDASPLHATATVNRPEIAKLLIDAGQSPDVRGGYDNATPLHLAAWNDSLEVSRVLVENRADVNARSGELHNNSPAGWAIVAGSADVFDYLMDSDAEVLDWFHDDAKRAVQGEFRQYKNVSQENYERILTRLRGESA